jgi:hypothetical protein
MLVDLDVVHQSILRISNLPINSPVETPAYPRHIYHLQKKKQCENTFLVHKQKYRKGNIEKDPNRADDDLCHNQRTNLVGERFYSRTGVIAKLAKIGFWDSLGDWVCWHGVG